MSKREPGAIRWKLSELLAKAGVAVSPYDLWTQEGFYRSRYHDLARWGSNHATYEGRKCHLCCWDTMSNCVRYGLTVAWWERDNHTMVEVYRKGPVKEKA
jgi:hypothetical protein